MLVLGLGSFGNEKTTQKGILVIFTRGMNSDFGFCLIINIWRLVYVGSFHLFYTILRGHLVKRVKGCLEEEKLVWKGGEPKVTTTITTGRKGEPPVLFNYKGSDLH